MTKGYKGVPVLGLFVLWVSCIPVEEKVPEPFDYSFAQPKVRYIADLQNEQDKDSLLSFLVSDDPSLRYAAAKAFSSFQDTTVLHELLPLLTDAHGQVRMMAAMAVGQLRSTRAESQLTSAFDGRDSARMFEAANSAILESMGKIGSTTFLRALSTISTYQPIDTLLLLGQARGLYQYALRQMTDPEGTATMVRYLADPLVPFSVRIVAANYLHRAQGIDLTPFANQIIASWHSESHPFLRMCLATALGKVKTPEAMNLLMESLATESDYRVKCNIIRALQGFGYQDVHQVILRETSEANQHIAEVAAQYFVVQGQERDVARYRAAMQESKSWQAQTKMAEAANKYMTSMFSSGKTSLQNEILNKISSTTDPYEKAAWLRAWGSELRNFESLPKYMQPEYHIAVRTQAVTSLIEACKDKNFDAYFAGEGHLIRAQIGGYLAQAMKSGDAGILALISGAITDPATGLKGVLSDQKDELNKAIAGLKLPDEMETYLEISKALKAYGIETAAIPEMQKKVKPIDWSVLDQIKPGTLVRISTSLGDIDLKLFPERAPSTVSAFVQLAKTGFYNGKPFHRVVPNFVIQTGCPRGDGFGSLDYTLRSELAEAYYDDEGYVGMASAGAHTEGTQFFITHSPAPHLDGRYTIFGKVTSGMNIVHQIGVGDTIQNVNILY